MSANLSILSRRRFISQLGAGACLATLAGLPAHGLANSGQSPLNFRNNASWLALHFNENALGMSANALAAAQQAVSDSGNRYADRRYEQLKAQLASWHDVHEEQLIFGNGSTEVIASVVTYAARLGAVVIEPTPTFGALNRYARAHAMQIISVPVNQHFQIELGALQQAAAKQSGPVLINLCNPNNPTGNIVSHKELVAWISQAPANILFLIDEAYFDFAQQSANYQSMLPLIQQGKDNLVITRTFSKIYGMAGLRMGYGCASPTTARKINPFAARFNLNVAGLAAAQASLTDTAYYATSLAATNRARQILTEGLTELGLAYVPSYSNFVLHQIGQPLADYAARMKQNRIKVGRKMTDSEYWNRISLGTPEQMQEFVKTLKAFRLEGWV